MKAFFVGQAPVWGELPTGARGIAHPAPHWDEEHHPNHNLWTFTTLDNPDEPLLCHVSDIEEAESGGLEGIYRWSAAGRYQDNQARSEHCQAHSYGMRPIRSTGWLEAPALLRSHDTFIRDNHVGGLATIVEVKLSE